MRNWMPVDKGQSSWNLLAINTRDRTMLGRWNSMYSDSWSELRSEREKEKDACVRSQEEITTEG